MRHKGLTETEVQTSRLMQGSNELTEKQRETIIEKVIDGFKDPMIVVLLVALAINVVFMFLGRAEWYEALGIFLAVCIANFAGVYMENKQEGEAMHLRAEEIAKERVKVYREGHLKEIGLNDVVTGDIVYLQAGDKIPADGTVIEGKIKVDQAAMNGETQEVTKEVAKEGTLGDIKDTLNPYYLFRGTVVTDSECLMEVLVVGDETEYGEMALEMQEDTRETPLKVKLGILAKQISTFGYIGATVIAASYIIQQIFFGSTEITDALGVLQILVEAVSLGVIIVVMAVPEGLPMIIALVLTMNTGKMMKDNVLVKKMSGIETAGGINILFSDKTGTITEGKLSVAEVATGDASCYTEITAIPGELMKSVVIGIGVNNSSKIDEGEVIGGNSTDRSLMTYLKGTEYEKGITEISVDRHEPFDSVKKMSAVKVGSKIYIKGAPEVLIERCNKYIDKDGAVQTLESVEKLKTYMEEQAKRSMRLIGVCIGEEGSEDKELTLVAIISIRDNVRVEATQAIETVKRAGVQVVMVTGDRKETAIAIAREASLMVSDDEIAITSSELAEKTDEELKELLPKLRVVARALPTDKSRLVRVAQEMDLVVAMTGDGVNDASALKRADVGFAMGSGTEVAKEAGDITIMDDNFSSIGKAILYGRTIFKSIRKFLIFQLTVNVGVVAISALSPIMGIEQPFSLITILAINLVMDTLAALAYGGEPALNEYMEDKPIGRQDSIITHKMMSQILTVGTYTIVVSMMILVSPGVQSLYGTVEQIRTPKFVETAMLVFFMLTILLNGVYARTEGNILKQPRGNKQFGWVAAIVIGLLVLLVNVIGDIAGLVELPINTWVVLIAISLVSLPMEMVRRVLIGRLIK